VWFQQSEFTELGQERIEEEQLGFARKQPTPKLAQHGVVKAGVSEFQAQQILPINAAADSIGGLTVGESFGKLEDGR
jgi:hypothetical protein